MYTMGDRNGKCSAICYDLKTHKQIWATPIDQAITHGPRCTPTIDGNRVYVMAPPARWPAWTRRTGRSSGSGT